MSWRCPQPLRLPSCSSTYKESRYLIHHLSIAHRDILSTCNFTDLRSTWQVPEDLINLLVVALKKPLPRCDLCNEKFTKYFSLDRHMERKHAGAALSTFTADSQSPTSVRPAAPSPSASTGFPPLEAPIHSQSHSMSPLAELSDMTVPSSGTNPPIVLLSVYSGYVPHASFPPFLATDHVTNVGYASGHSVMDSSPAAVNTTMRTQTYTPAPELSAAYPHTYTMRDPSDVDFFPETDRRVWALFQNFFDPEFDY